MSRSRPAFSLQVPMHVPDDPDASDSDSEVDYLPKTKYTQEYLDKPPFVLDTKARGTVVIEPFKTMKVEPYEKSRIEKFNKKLAEESFVAPKEKSKEYASSYLAVTYGLNRMLSVSDAKNKTLLKELEADTGKHGILTSVTAFYWLPRWKSTITNKTAEQEDVQDFYRQLKQSSPKQAKKFRNEIEKPTRDMIPYREIREELKHDQHTELNTKSLRARNPISDIYVCLIDSDAARFVHDDFGIFAAYQAMYLAAKISPDIMTTGYEFAATPSFPLLPFASTLDRETRAATARFFPLGVYYPEPNLCIRLCAGLNTLRESFLERDAEGEVLAKNYTTPNEAMIMINHVRARENFYALFSSQNPLVIHAPERAEFNKQHGVHEFDAEVKEGKMENWTASDVVTLTRSITQSHANPKAWADNVVAAITLKTTVTLDGNVTNNGSIIRQIMISLLSRLFAMYDPVALMKERGNNANVQYKFFQKQLHDYTPNKKPLPKTDRKERKKEVDEAIWVYVDKCKSKTKLLTMIDALIEKGPKAKVLDAAACAAGKSINETFARILKV